MDKYKKPAGNRRGKKTPDSRKGKSSETRPSYSRRRDEEDPPREKRTYSSTRPSSPRKRDENEAPREKRPYSSTRPSYSRKRDENEAPHEKRDSSAYPKRRTSDSRPSATKRKPRPGEEPEGDLIRLNRYIANAGICSRREADKLIEAGAVQVNGKVVTELGTKVSRTDKISYGDQALSREKLRYVLLNKPKGFITTTDDPENRKTVMNLIARACKERIYPVGRLDRNTTGLLLFTNDGEIAKRLSHPRYGIKKIYHVGLDKNVSVGDMKSILAGMELEDGIVKADAIEFVGDGKDKKEIGLELHTGQNRVVRRIFEKLGYKVVKLDRVYYAGLTKKNLPRGEWRFLEEKELNMLKMIGT
ncbi:MAG TPA: pseudouridine synthase [Bacteroidales bacterium]|nr:pseudouridine synthase [Bacteroidales bacterium]